MTAFSATGGGGEKKKKKKRKKERKKERKKLKKRNQQPDMYRIFSHQHNKPAYFGLFILINTINRSFSFIYTMTIR